MICYILTILTYKYLSINELESTTEEIKLLNNENLNGLESIDQTMWVSIFCSI